MINKLKVKSKKSKASRAFTLVELLVAVALFSVIVAISLGSVLSIFDANRRAQSAKTAVDNLSLSLENMLRTVRFGNTYYCDNGSGSVPAPLTTANCTVGDDRLAVNFDGATVVYRKTGSSIEISTNGGGSYTPITAPEMKVNYLKFYVFNTGNANSMQPYVIAVIEGYVGNKLTAQSRFSIQTLMSQRALDI